MINDTISAISTPIGPGAIGIIRLSGPRAHHIIEEIFTPYRDTPPKPFVLRLGYIRDPETGQKIDEVLVSIMKAPFSYTREDMAEINSHSGFGVLTQILELTFKYGARLARPGEFTYRAYLNGRIDLAQAEAILDLISAPSKEGLSIAFSTLKGNLSERIHHIRERLLDLLKELEALIDFPEEDLEISWDQIEESLKEVIQEISELIEAHNSRRLWLEGIHVVIGGRTNAGKSSLLNRLVDSPKAIVTPIPGTTRDLLEVPFLLEGIPLKLIDTAGIGIPKDEAERIGIERALKGIEEADTLIYVVDQTKGIFEEDLGILEKNSKKAILALNKCDLPINPKLAETLSKVPKGICPIYVSALSGSGIEELKKAIRENVLKSSGIESTPLLSPNLRQTAQLKAAQDSLKSFLKLSKENAPLDILAEELREAIRHLDEVIGKDISDEVLEKIFSSFCIGK